MANEDDNDWKKSMKKVVETSDGYIKGSKAYHVLQGSNYKIVMKSAGNCKVDIIDKAARTSAFHLDKAHAGANFNHN